MERRMLVEYSILVIIVVFVVITVVRNWDIVGGNLERIFSSAL